MYLQKGYYTVKSIRHHSSRDVVFICRLKFHSLYERNSGKFETQVPQPNKTQEQILVLVKSC